MEIKETKLNVKSYDSVRTYVDSYIFLNKGKKISLTFNQLLNYILYYGGKIFDKVPNNFLDTQELTLEYKSILDIFVNFFNDEGFTLLYDDEVHFSNSSLHIISKNDIISMCIKMVKLYIFQVLYDEIIINQDSPDNYKDFMKMIHLNHINKDILFGKLHSELKDYSSKNKNLKIELEYYKTNEDDVDTISSFCLTFNDWYAFALYNMIYNCFNFDKKRVIICVDCGMTAIKTNNRQIRCKKCSEKNKKYNHQRYIEGKI